jgi:hypothetical protein
MAGKEKCPEGKRTVGRREGEGGEGEREGRRAARTIGRKAKRSFPLQSGEDK